MKTICRASLIIAFCLGLWPALVGAAPPAPQGTLVYSEEFSDATKSGLEDNLNAADYGRGFHAPGVYHLRLMQADDTRWALLPNQTYDTFTVELDLWDNSDDFAGDMTMGVVVRAQDATHLYAVLLDPRKGQYAARKLNGAGEWTDLLAWKATSLIKPKSEVNHLRVDGVGAKFTVYLNGETLDSFEDSAYAQGQIGLLAGNIDATQPHVHFDNLKIYAPRAQAGTLPPSGRPDPISLAALASLAVALLAAGAWVLRRSRVANPSK
jgi:hypothetical protein